MLDYKDFTRTVCGRLEELYPGRRVDVHRIMKPNLPVRDGLTVLADGGLMSPMVYINDLYDDYEAGEPIDALIKDVDEIMSGSVTEPGFDVSKLKDFGFMKDHIVYKLINYENNRELLREVPHRRFMDLALVYYFILDSGNIGRATSDIFNTHMLLWGVDEQTVFEHARVNTPKLMGWEIQNMDQMIGGLVIDELKDQFDDEDEFEAFSAFVLGSASCPEHSPMFVLTNTDRMNGAACVLYTDVLENFAREKGGDLYVLPSSVHEVILIPCSQAPERSELAEMVREINQHELAPSERLSDNVYRYSLEKGTLTV